MTSLCLSFLTYKVKRPLVATSEAQGEGEAVSSTQHTAHGRKSVNVAATVDMDVEPPPALPSLPQGPCGCV